MTRSASTCSVAALLLSFALLASGCTARQSRDQYESRLAAALETRTSVTNQLDRRSLASAAAYDQASEQVQSAAAELDADAPPKDVQHAHDRMMQGLDGLAALLDRRGRCERLAATAEQDARACRKSISQDVYDEIRNDFGEADTIYREEGFALPGMGGGEDQQGGGDQLDDAADGGDEL